jgi:uncharacterized protein YecT (DUF1311 family)
MQLQFIRERFMLLLVASVLVSTSVQDLGPQSPRPAYECAEHLTNDRARRNCLRDLLEDAEDRLDAAQTTAAQEARESDLDTGGMFGAVEALDAAQQAWVIYRDAECNRRSSLLFVDDDAREEMSQDCRIALTRARSVELLEN